MTSWRLERQLPMLRAERHRRTLLHRQLDIIRPLVCTCDEPDEQPIGGWWPDDVTACERCGRPVR